MLTRAQAASSRCRTLLRHQRPLAAKAGQWIDGEIGFATKLVHAGVSPRAVGLVLPWAMAPWVGQRRGSVRCTSGAGCGPCRSIRGT